MDDRRRTGSSNQCAACGSSRLTHHRIDLEARAFDVVICADCDHVDRRRFPVETQDAAADKKMGR